MNYGKKFEELQEETRWWNSAKSKDAFALQELH